MLKKRVVTKRGNIDPKSKEALGRMTDYLKSLPAFTLHGETSKDELVDTDVKVQKSANVTISFKRQDRLRIDVDGDNGARSFIYDGKTLVVFAKTENYYATMQAPPTMQETLDEAMNKHGVELPLVDLLYAALGEDMGTHKIVASAEARTTSLSTRARPYNTLSSIPPDRCSYASRPSS